MLRAIYEVRGAAIFVAIDRKEVGCTKSDRSSRARDDVSLDCVNAIRRPNDLCGALIALKIFV